MAYVMIATVTPDIPPGPSGSDGCPSGGVENWRPGHHLEETRYGIF
jgi:hypothetical protein